MGLFNFLLTTDDSEEVGNQEHLANYEANRHRRVSSPSARRDKSRRSANADARAMFENEVQKHNDTLDKLDQVTEERNTYKKLAVTLTADRQAIMNTIAYLEKKWGKPGLAQDIQKDADDEYRRLVNDPSSKQAIKDTCNDMAEKIRADKKIFKPTAS